MTVAKATANRWKQMFRALLAGTVASLLVAGPETTAWAQNQNAQNQSQGQSGQSETNQQATAPAPTVPPVSLGVAKHDFSHGPKAFPTLNRPYLPIGIEHQDLTNSPRIDQLIHDGKLQLSLQDAIELALENNLDIIVQRYTPWFADTGILRAKAGFAPGGISGSSFPGSTATTIPFLNFDPQILINASVDDRATPINNVFTTGVGTAAQANTTALDLISHTTVFNAQYVQSFTSGTTFSAVWDNTRGSEPLADNLFNPFVQSSLTVGFSQQLLNGCCFGVNRRNILIAKNNRKIADYDVAQQAITTVTNTITAYWELVYARENVKVEEQAVTVSDKLYNDNKKQLEIGTLAPLDVTRAEAQLATDQQNLIVARTTQLQDEQILKNAITKDPLAANLVNVEIIPTDYPANPAAIEAPSFEDALKEAFAKRPELQQEALNLKNADINIKATINALRPILTLNGSFTGVGLTGNLTSNTAVQSGFTTAQSQIFHATYPDFTASLNLQLPLRNRSAQADNQQAILTQRQMEAQMQSLRNAALLDVRNTYIALTQDRARVEAAAKARELQQQTFEAEQKKYQLGASTVYNVILTQRDLITAQGTELRALADLVEAKANYERALGRTLEVNRVTIAEAKTGVVERDTLIPGTINGQVIGTDKIFDKLGSK